MKSLEEKLREVNAKAYKLHCLGEMGKKFASDEINTIYFVLDGGLDISHVLEGRCSLQEVTDFSMQAFEEKVDSVLERINRMFK